MVWTRFWDMASGGYHKEKATKIYIEASESRAIDVFKKKFGHDPINVTCSCCGEDYAIEKYPTLQQASGYHRNCDYQYVDDEGKLISKIEWHQLPTEKRGEGYFVERPNEYGRYQTMEEYVKNPDVMVIERKEVESLILLTGSLSGKDIQ